jgi:hypothetical protein
MEDLTQLTAKWGWSAALWGPPGRGCDTPSVIIAATVFKQ